MRTNPHRIAPRLGAAAIKNLHRIAVQVSVPGLSKAFRRGDVARVHLQEFQGGGLRCAARCPGFSTHSLPQVTSAGRNLITVFSSVNTLRQLFSAAPEAVAHADRPCKRRPGTVRMHAIVGARCSPFMKVLFLRRFFPWRREHRIGRQHSCDNATTNERACDGLRIGPKIICITTRIFASHKPICAEMRKPSGRHRAPRSARTRRVPP